MHEQGKKSDAITIVLGALFCVAITIATKKFQTAHDYVGENTIYFFGYVPGLILLLLISILYILRKLFFKKSFTKKDTYQYVYIGNSTRLLIVYAAIEMLMTFIYGWVVAFIFVLYFSY